MENADLSELMGQLLGPGGSRTPAYPSQQLVSSLAPQSSATNGVEGGGSSAASVLSSISGVLGNAATETQEKLARQLAELTGAANAQTESLKTNTAAVVENSLAAASTQKGSTAGTIGKTVLSFLGGGFGLVQLLGSLFGGSKEQAAPVSTSYAAPSSVQMDMGLLSSSPLLQPLQYSQDGLPRVQSPAPPPAVTVQVQAMDSRSFLDHSDDIAQAVRQALLNSHALNDVVTDL